MGIFGCLLLFLAEFFVTFARIIILKFTCRVCVQAGTIFFAIFNYAIRVYTCIAYLHFYYFQGENVEAFLLKADIGSVIMDMDPGVIKNALFGSLAKFEKFPQLQFRYVV